MAQLWNLKGISKEKVLTFWVVLISLNSFLNFFNSLRTLFLAIEYLKS